MYRKADMLHRRLKLPVLQYDKTNRNTAHIEMVSLAYHCTGRKKKTDKISVPETT